jgi:hypothetical protein
MDERDQRASSRLQVAIGALVISRIPAPTLSEFGARGLLIDVSYYGCQVFLPAAFPAGALLEILAAPPGSTRVHNVEAYVIWSKPVPTEQTDLRWKMGLGYVIPGNHWNVHPLPQSWATAEASLSLEAYTAFLNKRYGNVRQ